MRCQICGSEDVTTIYNDYIRRGSFGHMTDFKVLMHQCLNCGIIFHEKLVENLDEYYSSMQYRSEMSEGDHPNIYYDLHDKEVLEKLVYTGTSIFRNKVVMDIGCGGGSFLDFLLGVAKITIGVEPTEQFRNQMSNKGHTTYAYAEDALSEWEGEIDLITSFDVIEHVDKPLDFLSTAISLLAENGKVIIGTPSEQPIMKKLLGEEYEPFLYSFQHPWIFSEKSYHLIASKVGFKNINIVNKQRYGLSNAIAWLKNHRPMGNIKYEFVSELLEEAWMKEIESSHMGDYLILYANKG